MKKILYVKWGGLGDHLAFSTLPEEFSKHNFDFYISDKSEFRSQEIYDLVWDLNPFVKGFTSEEPNCGHIENWGCLYKEVIDFNLNISMHKNIESFYNIDSNIDHPRIYYKPNNLTDYNNYILVDLNTSSIGNYKHDLNKIIEHITSLKNENILYISSESSYGNSIISDYMLNQLNIEYIKTNNIFHYVDLIFSCKKFVSFWSGGSHVAASIKKFHKNNLEIDCLKVDTGLKDWGTINKSFFWYDNVNYIPC